jgi:shikimate dehydrogenase
LRQFGLIGFPLSHSFSQGYFKNKFETEGVVDASYQNYPIPSIDEFEKLWEHDPQLMGLNVTIPYKKEVIPFLQHPSTVVKSIHACNCIRKFNNELYGYNTDVIGFEKSLLPFLKAHHTHALILGTGGAAAAVEWVLQKLKIQYQLVSRKEGDHVISYNQLNAETIASHTLLINTSPVGMYPNVNEAPELPYEAIGSNHHLFDLIYNPSETLFLAKGKAQGATIQNGLEMLHIQAAESWKIWTAENPIVQ